MMTDQQRANAIYDLEQIEREHERLEQLWDDITIAVLELEFIWGATE